MPHSTKTGYKNLLKSTKDKIVKDFKNGMSYEEIRQKYNLTRRGPREIILEYGLRDISRRKNRYTLDENYFHNIDSPEKAYWLGVIAADGCITKTNYFALASIDKELLERLKKDLNYTGDIYIPSREENENWSTTYRINFSSKILCNDLRNLGIHEKKSSSYNDFPKIEQQYIPHFIRGYFDGDGCITSSTSSYYKNDKKYSYNGYWMNIIATKDFCEKLHDLFIHEFQYDAPIKKHTTSNMYYIYIHKKTALRDFYCYLYRGADFYLTRKHKKFINFLSSFDEKSSSKNDMNCWKTDINIDNQQPNLLIPQVGSTTTQFIVS